MLTLSIIDQVAKVRRNTLLHVETLKAKKFFVLTLQS